MIHLHRSLTSLMAALAFSLPGAQALADLNLDADNSSIQFISVKNNSIAEIHSFKGLEGNIDEAGQATVQIPLDAVETLIPIRNERMRELLFETSQFPVALLTATVNPQQLRAMTLGQQQGMELEFTLSLHGISKNLKAAVSATRLEGAVEVSTLSPLIIRATDFGLSEGITKLQEIAGLQSIATAVPIDARLVFRFQTPTAAATAGPP